MEILYLICETKENYNKINSLKLEFWSFFCIMKEDKLKCGNCPGVDYPFLNPDIVIERFKNKYKYNLCLLYVEMLSDNDYLQTIILLKKILFKK